MLHPSLLRLPRHPQPTFNNFSWRWVPVSRVKWGSYCRLLPSSLRLMSFMHRTILLVTLPLRAVLCNRLCNSLWCFLASTGRIRCDDLCCKIGSELAVAVLQSELTGCAQTQPVPTVQRSPGCMATPGFEPRGSTSVKQHFHHIGKPPLSSWHSCVSDSRPRAQRTVVQRSEPHVCFVTQVHIGTA